MPKAALRKPDIILAELGLSTTTLLSIYEEWKLPSKVNQLTPHVSYIDETISKDSSWRLGPADATEEEAKIFNNFKNALQKRSLLITAIDARVQLGEKALEVIASMELERTTKKLTVSQYIESFRTRRVPPAPVTAPVVPSVPAPKKRKADDGKTVPQTPQESQPQQPTPTPSPA